MYFTNFSATPEGLPDAHGLPRDLERWIERELQALTLEEDMGLITQPVLGILRHQLTPAKPRYAPSLFCTEEVGLYVYMHV